jgi:hypothetical protein
VLFFLSQAERAGVDIVIVEVGSQHEGDGGSSGPLPGRIALHTDTAGLVRPDELLNLRQKVYEALSKHSPPTMLQSKL